MKLRNGFSIVEMMIAAGVLAGLAIVAVQLTKTQTKATVQNSFSSEATLITNEIVSILSDPDKCLTSLGGQDAMSASGGIESMGGKYFIKTSKEAPPGGYGHERINISAYSLNATPEEIASNNSTLMIHFEVKNILKNSNSATSSTFNKRINLYVKTDTNNKITFCRSLSSSTTDIWTRGSASKIYYKGGNVGIGLSNPNAALDVSGEVRVGNTGSECTASTGGSLRYNSSTGLMEYCNGVSTIWTPMGALKQNDCYWSGVPSQGNFICPTGYYVAGVCFTNASGGCSPSSSGSQEEINSAGGIYCCKP